MNGREARARRRAELPPDLAAEARDRIAVAGAARPRAERAARDEYDDVVRRATLARKRAYAEADATFQEARDAAYADAVDRAAERGVL
jgi:hypothetical protein